jgi:hypothetical protein
MMSSLKKVPNAVEINIHTQSSHRIVPAPTKAEIQLNMMEEELRAGTSRGLVAWLADGLKIEESQ